MFLLVHVSFTLIINAGMVKQLISLSLPKAGNTKVDRG